MAPEEQLHSMLLVILILPMEEIKPQSRDKLDQEIQQIMVTT